MQFVPEKSEANNLKLFVLGLNIKLTVLFVISSPGLLLGKATVLEFIFSVVEIEKLYVVLGLLSTIVSMLAGLPIP